MDQSFQVIEVKLSHDHTPNLGQEVFEWNIMGSHHKGDVYTICGHDAKVSGKNEPRSDTGFWLRVVESNTAAAKVKPKISSYYNPQVLFQWEFVTMKTVGRPQKTKSSKIRISKETAQKRSI